MRARAEIERLVDKLSRGDIHEDEPLFCLRARDITSASAVRLWAMRAKAVGAPAEKVEEAMRLAGLMDKWPVKQVPGDPSSVQVIERAPYEAPMYIALAAVMDERIKSLQKWDDRHDDGHDRGEMVIAAAELLLRDTDCSIDDTAVEILPEMGDGQAVDPWRLHEKHPNRMDRLAIAAALVLAEMEREARHELRRPIVVTSRESLIEALDGDPSKLAGAGQIEGAAFAGVCQQLADTHPSVDLPESFVCGETFKVQKRKVIVYDQVTEYPFPFGTWLASVARRVKRG